MHLYIHVYLHMYIYMYSTYVRIYVMVKTFAIHVSLSFLNLYYLSSCHITS